MTDNRQIYDDDRFPNIWVCLGWVVLFLALQLISGFAVLGIALGLDDSGRGALELAQDMRFIALPTIISLLLASFTMLGLMWLHLKKHDRATRIGLTRWSSLDLGRTIGWSIALIGLGLVFNYLYATYAIPDIKSQEQMRRMFAALPNTVLNQALLIMAVAVIAPVLEELLFRGLLQTALIKYLPAWAAILGAAVVFALVHGQVYAFPALVTMGAVFGVLYYKTGSLRVTILAHALNNAAALILT
jgi:membrane protease YdiL (CAAX protease family)